VIHGAPFLSFRAAALFNLGDAEIANRGIVVLFPLLGASCIRTFWSDPADYSVRAVLCPNEPLMKVIGGSEDPHDRVTGFPPAVHPKTGRSS